MASQFSSKKQIEKISQIFSSFPHKDVVKEDDCVEEFRCNGADLDDYTQFGVNLQPDQEDVFPDFGSYGVNLQQELEEVFSIGAQLDLASYNGVVQQESEQVCIAGGQNDCGVMQEEKVEINSGSSGGAVKQEHEHLDDNCLQKRIRTGSCSRGGTKACRERLIREKLNERFMDLSSVLEPGRSPKTDKQAILIDIF